MDKKEYKKQLKQLIKKYHPDLCKNSYLESMYNSITKVLVNKLNQTKENKDNDTKSETAASRDYLYYKSGIKYYKNIHPDKFYKRNQDFTYKTKTYNELVSVLNTIYLSFNLSEYYFRKIINEYPQSSYYHDSAEKIALLKKLYKSYENIRFDENITINNKKYMDEMGLNLL